MSAAEVARTTGRHVVVLAAAAAMMWGVPYLSMDGAGGSADALTLAAIGFVLLATSTTAELLSGLGLPRVTGYILAGVALGPAALDLVPAAVVADLGTFNKLGLGLIATTAGLELHIPAIRRVLPTLSSIVVATLIVVPVLVGVPLWVADSALSLSGLADPTAQGVLALLTSVLAMGTSASIALAVVNETGSKGRLTDLLLALAVVKDVVLVTMLAVAIAISQAVLGGTGLDAHVLLVVGEELASSVVVGALVGAAFIAYFRFVRVEPVFSVLVAVLLVVEATKFLHLELLLVFIVAGFVVRNLSAYEHAFLDPLERISLPVFLVFFTTLGASVDLRATLAILPLAGIVVAGRAVALWLVARIGSRVGHEGPAVARNAWLTHLPQAGVEFGLVMLAAEGVPALRGEVTQLGMALVTLNLLVGPVAQAFALGRAGETAAARARAPEEPPREAPAPRSAAPLPDLPWSRPADPELDALLRATVDRIDVDVREFVARQPAGLERAAATLFDRIVDALDTAPWEVRVPLDPARIPRRKVLVRLRAALGGLIGWPQRRRVPARLALRLAFEPRLADALVDACAAAWRAEAAGTDPREQIAALLDRAVRDAERDAARRLDAAGGPEMPTASLRFADVEARVAAAVGRLARDGERWAALVAASRETARQALATDALAGRMSAALAEHARDPGPAVAAALAGPLGALADALDALGAAVGPAPAEEHLTALAAAAHASFTPALAADVAGATDAFRRSTRAGLLVAGVGEVAPTAGRVRVVDLRQPVETAARPEDVRTFELAPGAAVRTLLQSALYPAVDAALGPVAELVATAEERVHDAVAIARHGAELAARGGFVAVERREIAEDGFRRGARRLRDVAAELTTTGAAAAEAVMAAERAVAAPLRALAAPEGSRVGRTVEWSVRAGLDTARRGWRGIAARAADLDGLAAIASELPPLRDLRIRSGRLRLDASGIHAYLQENLPTPESRALPAVFVRWMTPSPVTELRMFVARTALLDDVLDALGPAPRAGAPSTLVVGPPGAGRTSLLRMAKLQVAGPRLLWLDPTFADRSGGPLRALAGVLDTAPEVEAVAEALQRVATVVVLDDLQAWLLPGPAGLPDLDAFLTLVDVSGAPTRWLVSADASACALLEEISPIRQVFRRVLTLPPLGWRELRAIVRQRELLGGVAPDYGARGVGRALELLRPGTPPDRYFRALARAAGGSPGVALQVHLQGVRAAADGLHVLPPALPALPFADQIGADGLALLATIARYGPLDAHQAAHALGRPDAAVASRLGFLAHAGLVEPAGSTGRRLRLAARVAPAIRCELTARGVLGGGAP